MKKPLQLVITLATTFFLTSCGGSNQPAATEATPTATTENAAAAPVINIETTTWTKSDLSAVSPQVAITLNLPQDAPKEKNGNGGVDIRLNEAYLLTVSATMVSNIKEALDGVKSLTTGNATSYKNGKIISEEPNGFVYTMQMNDEANGTQYQPEAHFAYCLEKDGAFYLIQDARPMDNGFLPGSSYTEENAKKLFESVKASAKAK